MAASDLVVIAAAVAAMLSTVLEPGMALPAGSVAGVGFALTVGLMHGYDTRRAASGPHEYGALLRGSWVWASVLMVMLYVTAAPIAPGRALLATGAGVAAVFLARLVARTVVKSQRRAGQWQRPTLLVGDPQDLRSLASRLREDPSYGFDIVGLCTSTADLEAAHTPVLGDLSRSVQIIAEHGIRVVIVAASCMSAIELRRFCWEIEPYGVELIVAPNIEEVAPVRVALRPISGTPLLTVAVGPSRAQRVLKGAMDRTLGLLLLIAALPVLCTSALLIRLSSPGPALYRQIRYGQAGEQFTMIKLRTMYTDADRRRAELLERSDGNELMFKMRQDPRITPVGRVLRRFSIDELPQLWNVVRGDMSLVGPRPPLGEEMAGYDHDAHQRLRVRPGLTGLWQVSGRSDLDWEQTVRLDLHYVDNWSVLMDMTILLRTFRAVFGGRGAY